ncbi:MAG: L-threonylcarbamoyladenylate synthase type 1 TsaC, partial [Treponema sp.]|nr:L-threonylcarbamoyladenylate synthase type 1 TsaC [Treponema sp.]
PGGLPKEAIEAVIGTVKTAAASSSDTAGPLSPGMLKSHYAPRVPLKVYDREALFSAPRDPQAAFLFFDGASRDSWLSVRKEPEAAVVKVLSETGNTLEAAACLFETLHALDRSGVKRINAQLAPESGLGAAINDRLLRASAGN